MRTILTKSAFLAVISLFLLAMCVRAMAAPVNVNTADVDALAEMLTGIGPKIAEAIVDYRKANGPFESVDELLNVKGVGPKTLERNKADIMLTDQHSENTGQ